MIIGKAGDGLSLAAENLERQNKVSSEVSLFNNLARLALMARPRTTAPPPLPHPRHGQIRSSLLPQVAVCLSDPNLAARMAVMHELSLPVDVAINSFMARTRNVNRLDLQSDSGDSSSDSLSDMSSDGLDSEEEGPILRPPDEVDARPGPNLIDIIGGASEAPGASDHVAFGPSMVSGGDVASGPEISEPPELDIRDVELMSLPKIAKHFLHYVSGGLGKDVISRFVKAFMRLFLHGVDSTFYGGQFVGATAINVEELFDIAFESIADVWLRMCFFFQCFPWLGFSLLLPNSFPERWIELRRTASKCDKCVDTEFTAGIFQAMPWDSPQGVEQRKLLETFKKGLLDIACKALSSSDSVECHHASSNMHVVRHKCGLAKQSLNPVHFTMATYCLRYVADHRRHARYLEQKLLPSRRRRAEIVKSYGRKGCNQYSQSRDKKVRKTISKKTPRRISAWNVFQRERASGKQLHPMAWVGEVRDAAAAWTRLKLDEPDKAADYVVQVGHRVLSSTNFSLYFRSCISRSG